MCARRIHKIATAVACAILAVASGTYPNQTARQSRTMRTQQQATSGRAPFESTCAACHGLDGQGGERGPNIASRREVLRLSDPELLKILHDGIPSAGMPPFASLGSARLAALVAYVRTLQGNGKVTAIPGDPQKDRQLFFGSARCSECHIVRGKGGFVAADLSHYAATVSVPEIRAAITSPGIDSPQRRTLITVILHNGQMVEGVIRNEDNFSLQLQSLDGSFHLFQKSDIAKVEPHAQTLMPSDYASTLTAAQLDDLIGYLMTVARETKGTSSSKPNWEDDH
jgi:cytochrome c oxidase cbb3-type subunit 3